MAITQGPNPPTKPKPPPRKPPKGGGGGGVTSPPVPPSIGDLDTGDEGAYSYMPSDDTTSPQDTAATGRLAQTGSHGFDAMSGLQGQGEDVWVTVPVDKVSVAGGAAQVVPAYQTTRTGYQPAAQGSKVPATPPAGRPNNANPR